MCFVLCQYVGWVNTGDTERLQEQLKRQRWRKSKCM